MQTMQGPTLKLMPVLCPVLDNPISIQGQEKSRVEGKI